MNYILPKFDEELYESLYENIAVNNGKRYKSEDKNKFISNLTNFLKTNSHLFDAKRVTEGDNTNNYLLSYDNDLSSKVIFSAHYDTVKNTPGFNDNSSGLILSMMFLLKCNIPVLLTDGEERKIFQRCLGLKGSKAICKEFLYKDKTIIVLDSVGIGKYLIYNCSDKYINSLELISKNNGMLFKPCKFTFGTDANRFKKSGYDVISLSRSSCSFIGYFWGMHCLCDTNIKTEKIRAMYYLVCEILEKLNLFPVDNMEKA